MLFAITLALAVVMVAAPADAHDYQNSSSVRADSSGGRMFMRDYTAYNGAFTNAVIDWNSLNCYWGDTCEGVFVQQITTTNDAEVQVDWFDVNDCTVSTVGKHQTFPSPDKILLNICYMERLDTDNRQGVGRHETGHALAAGHTPETESWKPASIMYPNQLGTDYLQQHDRQDYYSIWVGGNAGDTTP